MSEWIEYKLNDMTEPIKDTYIPTGSDNLNYIGLEHIEQETLRLTSVGNSKDIYSNKFIFKANDVLFGKLRVYFRKVTKPKFNGICSTDIWVFRAKSGIDQDFLFYFLANWDFVNLADGGEGGTRMPRADWNFLSKTEWKIPSLPEQKAIAGVLSSLDDKIDLLHRQNKTLEAMAETLFRQWFIEAKPQPSPNLSQGERNKIMTDESWEEYNLLEIIKLVGGGTPKTVVEEYWNGEIDWLSGGDISNNHKSFITSSEKKITEEGLNNSAAKLLPKFSTVISARGTVGKYCLLGKPMSYSQTNYGILPQIDDCYFFTYLIINYIVSELQSAAYGSVFDTITTATFKDQTIVLPEEKEIINFENSIKVYFEKMLSNTTQIRTLEKLRDTLLPKLMSGEIRLNLD